MSVSAVSLLREVKFPFFNRTAVWRYYNVSNKALPAETKALAAEHKARPRHFSADYVATVDILKLFSGVHILENSLRPVNGRTLLKVVSGSVSVVGVGGCRYDLVARTDASLLDVSRFRLYHLRVSSSALVVVYSCTGVATNNTSSKAPPVKIERRESPRVAVPAADRQAIADARWKRYEVMDGVDARACPATLTTRGPVDKLTGLVITNVKLYSWIRMYSHYLKRYTWLYFRPGGCVQMQFDRRYPTVADFVSSAVGDDAPALPKLRFYCPFLHRSVLSSRGWCWLTIPGVQKALRHCETFPSIVSISYLRKLGCGRFKVMPTGDPKVYHFSNNNGILIDSLSYHLRVAGERGRVGTELVASIGKALNQEEVYAGVVSSITQKLMLKDQSACVNHIDTQLYKIFKNRDEVLGKKRVCYISSHLPQEGKDLLRESFPELNLVFFDSVHNEHPMCNSVRYCFNVLFASAYKNVKFVDVGGSESYHVNMGNVNAHVCNPMVDWKDGGRRVRESMYLSDDGYKVCNVESLYKEVAAAKVTSCGGRFEDCGVSADAGFFVDVYDMSLQQLADGMEKKNMRTFSLALMYPVELLAADGEIYLETLDVLVKRDGDCVRYSVGVTGESYTHSYRCISAYFTAPAVVARGGTVFKVQYEGYRLGYHHISLCLSDSSSASVSVQRHIRTSFHGKSIVMIPRLNNGVISFERMVYDTDFVDRIYAYSLNTIANLENRTFEYAVGNVRAQKTHVITGTRVVHSKVDITSNDLWGLVVAVSTQAVKDRRKSLDTYSLVKAWDGNFLSVINVMVRHLLRYSTTLFRGLMWNSLALNFDTFRSLVAVPENYIYRVPKSVCLNLRSVLPLVTLNFDCAAAETRQRLLEDIRSKRYKYVSKVLVKDAISLMKKRRCSDGEDRDITEEDVVSFIMSNMHNLHLGFGGLRGGARIPIPTVGLASVLSNASSSTTSRVALKVLASAVRSVPRVATVGVSAVTSAVTICYKCWDDIKQYSDHACSFLGDVGRRCAMTMGDCWESDAQSWTVDKHTCWSEWVFLALDKARQFAIRTFKSLPSIVEESFRDGVRCFDSTWKSGQITNSHLCATVGAIGLTTAMYVCYKKRSEIRAYASTVVTTVNPHWSNAAARLLSWYDGVKTVLCSDAFLGWLYTRYNCLAQLIRKTHIEGRCFRYGAVALSSYIVMRFGCYQAVYICAGPQAKVAMALATLLGLIKGVVPWTVRNVVVNGVVSLLGLYYGTLPETSPAVIIVRPVNTCNVYEACEAYFDASRDSLTRNDESNSDDDASSSSGVALDSVKSLDDSTIQRIMYRTKESQPLQSGIPTCSYAPVTEPAVHTGPEIVELEPSPLDKGKAIERVNTHSSSEIVELEPLPLVKGKAVECVNMPHIPISGAVDTNQASSSCAAPPAEFIPTKPRTNRALSDSVVPSKSMSTTLSMMRDSSRFSRNKWLLERDPVIALDEQSEPVVVGDVGAFGEEAPVVEYILYVATGLFRLYRSLVNAARLRIVNDQKRVVFPAVIHESCPGISEVSPTHIIFSKSQGEDVEIDSLRYVFSVNRKRFETVAALKMADAATERYLVCDEMVPFHNALNLVAAIHLCAAGKVGKNFSKVTKVCVNAPPGGGKTTKLIQEYFKDRSGSCIMTANRGSAIDINDTIESIDAANASKAASNNVSGVESIDNYVCARTVNSQIMNCKGVMNYTCALVDEMYLMHKGLLMLGVFSSGARRAIFYGDINQIPFINREKCFYSKEGVYCPGKDEIIYTSESYRCPADVCMWLSSLKRSDGSNRYLKGVSCNQREVVLRSLSKRPVVSAEQVIQLEADAYITFKQECKEKVVRALAAVGRRDKVFTSHEAQGMTFGRVVLCRLSATDDSVFSSEPHILVALSRHTQSCVYATLSSKLTDKVGAAIDSVTRKEVSDTVLKTFVASALFRAD
nr:ORF-1a [Pineapple mealybug wilt-associated virus 2]